MKYLMNDDGTTRECTNLLEWASTFDTRWTHKTRVDNREVSTVFLGIDHNFSMDGPPVLFETMVFGPEPWEDYQERYTTKELAMRGHNVLVAALGQAMSPGDLGSRDYVDPDVVSV